MQSNPLETKRAHRDKVGVKAATAAKKIGTSSLLRHTCPANGLPPLKFASPSPSLRNKLLLEREEKLQVIIFIHSSGASVIYFSFPGSNETTTTIITCWNNLFPCGRNERVVFRGEEEEAKIERHRVGERGGGIPFQKAHGFCLCERWTEIIVFPTDWYSMENSWRAKGGGGEKRKREE